MKLWVRIVVDVGSSVAYLLLSVLAWGGFGPFFAHPALTALTVVTLAVAAVAVFAGGNVSPGVREDRGNRWVLVAFSVLGLLSGFVPALTDRLGVWTLDGDPLRWAGVTIYALGCALRVLPVFVLGNRFSGLVAIQPGHALVTTGIYGIIRHPSYLGLVTIMLGWSLAFRSGAGLLICAAMLPVLFARINAEERLLQEQFGASYDDYRSRTSRLIPGIY